MIICVVSMRSRIVVFGGRWEEYVGSVGDVVEHWVLVERPLDEGFV